MARLKAALCAIALAILASPDTHAQAIASPAIGSAHTGLVAIGAKQVPLPDGRWLVAGLGRNRPVAGIGGAFGTIESAILVRVAGTRIDAIAEINTNTLAVTNGWGTTAPCKQDGALAKLTIYRTRADNLCLFVKRTESGGADALHPDSWTSAQALIRERKFTHGEAWLTVGLRVSDRHNIVDVRYHFDDAPAGLPAGSLADAAAWKVADVTTSPARRPLLDATVLWAAGIAEPLELGLHGRLSGKTRTIPSPRETVLAHAGAASNGSNGGTASASGEPPSLNKAQVMVSSGRGGTKSRAEALAEVAGMAPVTAEQRQVYAKSIAETPLPKTDEDYFRTLVNKTISFNFFRVSVDYVLAYVVTVSAAVSAYITATIVATHSLVQIANDMWWDNYLKDKQNNGSDVVDFRYLGDRPVPVAVAS